MNEIRKATTIEALDAHLWHVQEALSELRSAVDQMATKQDIERIANRMEGFATKEQLAALEAKLQSETPASMFKRLSNLAKDLMPILALLLAAWGGMGAIVHFTDVLHALKAKP